MPSIYFIGSKNNATVRKASNLVKQLFPEADILLTNKQNIIPENLEWWRGDYILSFLSPLILPVYVLESAKIAAINFHPASPDYPGSHTAGLILSNKETTSAVTCHYMVKPVDSGPIIMVRKFPIYDSDTVDSLIERREAYALIMFFNILDLILKGQPLPTSGYIWTRRPYKR